MYKVIHSALFINEKKFKMLFFFEELQVTMKRVGKMLAKIYVTYLNKKYT